ncbi:MAG: HAD hydrolase family protein, partial [Kiritimatiellae bacterium]|nr:HAD hydrolase family protein [Kiritimatiellia bacterium]
RALQRFAEALGLTLDNCMALGDGLNDLTMIRAAGLGVAMANAHPDVLAVADAVTASNDEDGVAKAIERFCLKGG